MIEKSTSGYCSYIKDATSTARSEYSWSYGPDNMYEFASSHCDDFKDLRDDEDIVINQEWILNKLSENENE